VNSKTHKKPNRLTIEDIQQAISDGSIASCYLCAGTEQYIADEAVTLLRDAVVPPEQRSFNFDVLYGYDVDVNEIIALVSSYPMMGEKRLVVIKEFEKVKNPDALTPYIKNPLESTVLVLISGESDFRKNPYRAFGDERTLDCKPVYDNQVPQWVKKRVRQFNKTITDDAAAMLTAYTGTSLRQIVNEIEKLDIYTANRKTITIEDVNAVVGVTKAFNIFELYKAIGFKDASKAINILDKMLERGESATVIVRMLTRLFRQIALLSDLQIKNVPGQKIASQLQIHPYFLDEYYGYIKNHPLDLIPDRFRSLLSADISLKTTSKDQRLILSLLIYRLLDIEGVSVDIFEELEGQNQ
jgi:DNA polymerase III subunit delta